MLQQPLTASAVTSIAKTARDFEEIKPLPPLVALTGAKTAVWCPLDDGEYAHRRMIAVDGGSSPGLYQIAEAYRIGVSQVVGESECVPTPDQIAAGLAELQADWDDDERYRRAPHLFAGPVVAQDFVDLHDALRAL